MNSKKSCPIPQRACRLDSKAGLRHAAAIHENVEEETQQGTHISPSRSRRPVSRVNTNEPAPPQHEPSLIGVSGQSVVPCWLLGMPIERPCMANDWTRAKLGAASDRENPTSNPVQHWGVGHADIQKTLLIKFSAQSRVTKQRMGWIRTHERLSPLPVFKTGAFNRSATHSQATRGQSSRPGMPSG